MSLIYDESDVTEKDEDNNSEKITSDKKDKNDLEKNKNKKRIIKDDEEDDMLVKEALMNIPTKSVSLKKMKNRKKILSPLNIKDVYDTSMEGVDIPLLNNNINNGSLMLTELLDLDNNNSDNNKSKSKTMSNKTDEKEDKSSLFLKKKLDNINLPINLKDGINSGIRKTHDEIHDDFKNDILNISKKNSTINEILTLNKSHSQLFLTGVEKMSEQSIKRIQNLKLEQRHLKKNISKLEQSKILIENGIPLKSNVIDNNIRKSQLKNISETKDYLVGQLLKINQKIEILLKEEKLRKRGKIRPNFEILEDSQEQYNLHLAKLQEEQNLQRAKFNDDLKMSTEKRQKELDKKKKELMNKKSQYLKKMKDKERLHFLRRKKDVEAKLEKVKKYINEKLPKKISDYRFYKYKENFENNEKKLIDKVNMMKKDSLVTQKEIQELARKIKEQKKLLLEGAEEKKKQLIKLWTYRSQTLPVYKRPMSIKIEEEKKLKLEKEEEEKKKKECYELEKRNYKPPKVSVNEKLKIEREIRKNKTDKESVLTTELNNKKRLDKLSFSPIISMKNIKMIHELSQELNNNNYIDYNEIKSMMSKKSKKILKPIQILHPKPDKPIDYLSEMISDKNNKKSKSYDKEKKNEDNINNIFRKNKEKGGNIIESLKMVKAQAETIDNKVQQKKQILKLNGGYLNNPKLGDEVGDLLIESIQNKLSIMNKLNGE